MKKLATLVFLFLAHQTMALEGFTRIAACGSANIVSGENCNDMKIELNFSNCENKSEPQLAKKVICGATQIRARYESENNRYEAIFVKQQDDTWGGGGGTWKSAGANRQWRRVSSTPPVATPQAGATTPAASVSTPAPTAATAPASESAASLKFSGFADIRHTSFAAKNNITVPNSHAESGFGLEDGALYLNYEKDRVTALVDIAFRRAKDVDTNPSAIPNQSSNNNISIGVDKSQIYLKYKVLDILFVNAGQFDTVYGVELNDSKDRIFGKTGLVYDSTLPVTHTGLMLEVATHGF